VKTPTVADTDVVLVATAVAVVVDEAVVENVPPQIYLHMGDGCVAEPDARACITMPDDVS
jgi:hypothetical protein